MNSNVSAGLIIIIVIVIVYAMMYYNNGSKSYYSEGQNAGGDYVLEDNAYSKYQLPSYKEGYEGYESYSGSGGYGCPPCVQKMNLGMAPLPNVYSPGATSNYFGSGCDDPFDKYEGKLTMY
ncbi:hypothetical protein OAG24_00520 [bacterium]|nr:hypothetical protein [bacterium]